jgi:hypothetical protein
LSTKEALTINVAVVGSYKKNLINSIHMLPKFIKGMHGCADERQRERSEGSVEKKELVSESIGCIWGVGFVSS